ncbi:type II toxin-antitoxin system RelE/ParE family toxin [Blastomonas sp.]|uniref:type II toxin-antitoxin system RelE/ParE family toxin n=1 Tax=Blastomonas sp. TaxID=1909299 RepID=UPI00345DD8A2
MAKPKNAQVDESHSVLYRGQAYSIEQTAPFGKWLKALRDVEGRSRILKRLRRLADGNFGDCKSVGDGVSEIRMFFGPGYRAYFMMRGETIVLLLAGGDKDSQSHDIALAQELARKVRDDSGNKGF